MARCEEIQGPGQNKIIDRKLCCDNSECEWCRKPRENTHD